MKRRLLSVGAAVVAVALIANGVVAAPSAVRTTGDERVVPNAMVQATLRFTPGMIGAASGDEVTWTHDDKTDEPHTATIVEEFPEPTLDAIFGCAAPTEPCGQALAAHFALGQATVDPGNDGFNEPGDSVFFDVDDQTPFPESISAVVTAPAGTTLKYLCAIHPWMQGEIIVR
jgi:plastocyanin